jgi:hypothetical protein
LITSPLFRLYHLEEYMKKNHSVGLTNQLASYSSSAKSRTTLATLKQRLGNWPAYAAATGSVMAMATSASADIIRYTGGPVTAGPPPAGTNAAHASVPFGAGQSLYMRVFHTMTANTDRGFASAGAGLEVLHKSAAGLVLANLSTGQVISPAAPTLFQTGHSTLRSVNVGDPLGEWVPGVPGFEGFRFATNPLQPLNGNYDYGWAELEVNVDNNGVPVSVTLLGLAYNNVANAPIEAGQTTESPNASPEPGTAGLMLLALGAAGVTVLRHRRRNSKQQQAAQA